MCNKTLVRSKRLKYPQTHYICHTVTCVLIKSGWGSAGIRVPLNESNLSSGKLCDKMNLFSCKHKELGLSFPFVLQDTKTQCLSWG